MTELRIQLLGGFSISSQRTHLLPARRATRAGLLLAYLLLKPGKRISRQQLAYTFWPDSSDMQARTNLRGLLASLHRQAPQLFVYLCDDDLCLSWRLDNRQSIDVIEFEEALHRADSFAQTDREKAIGALTEAVSFYRGELLPGRCEAWVLAERQRLHSLYVDALTWLVEVLEAAGQTRDAIHWAETLVQVDRLREQSHLRLLRLLVAIGERARALAAYAGCASVLRQELGVDPGQEIEALHKRLLTEPVIDRPALAPGVSPSALVGRSQEWHRLSRLWRKAQGGNPHIVLLTGEAGIGKTRLAQQLLSQCEREGAMVLATSCPQAKQPVAYLALAGWLASPKLAERLERLNSEQAAHLQLLSPALRRRHRHVRPPIPLAPHWQRLHLHQALAGFFTEADEPVLLFLDDAQWCDDESLDWLQYLMLARQHARLLVVLSVRTGERRGQMLAHVGTELLAKGRLEQIELGRLTYQETVKLAHQVTASPLDVAQLDRLYALSAGVPFFVIELAQMVKDASSSEMLTPTLMAPHINLPSPVTALLLHRLASLSATARQLLEVAAVVGDRCTGPVLFRIGRLTEDEHGEALGEVLSCALLVKGDGDLYTFGHELIREVIYQQLSAVRRRHLHTLAANTLATLHAEEMTSYAAQIATHLEHADRWLDAAHYWLLATAREPDALSINIASAYLNHAIELLARLPKSSQANELTFVCWLQLGTLRLRHKGYDDSGAQHAFEQANAASRTVVDPRRRFLALRGLWEVKWGTGQLYSALEVSAELLEIATFWRLPEAMAEAYWTQGATLFYLGEYARAEEILRNVLDVEITAGSVSISPNTCQPAVAAQCYLAFIETLCGDPDLGVDAMRGLVETAERHADPYTFLFALTHLALLQHIVRDLNAVAATSQRLLELSAQYDFDGMMLVASRLGAWATAMHTGSRQEVDRLYQMVMNRAGVTADIGSLIFVVALAEVLMEHGRRDDALLVVETGLRIAQDQGAALLLIDLHRLRGGLRLHIDADPSRAPPISNRRVRCCISWRDTPSACSMPTLEMLQSSACYLLTTMPVGVRLSSVAVYKVRCIHVWTRRCSP